MNRIEHLLEKVRLGTYCWEDFNEILSYEEIELEYLFRFTQEITNNNFKNTLKIYNPTLKFPAISITGNYCALQCEHCNKKYLNNMKHIINNKELETFLVNLYNNNGTGVLLSGGCESDGSVPLYKYLKTIKKIKKKTNLIINTHTGLLNKKTAKKLSKANIDIISFDINMDEEIIHNIYHLEKNLNDYKKSIVLLKKHDLNIVPHVCIGLYYGKIHKEINSIEFIKEQIKNPSLIVFIALIPPKNSAIKFESPKPIEIAKIIAITRLVFPQTEISLGCMRPRKNVKVELEKYAIKAGVNRIEIPSHETIRWVKQINPKITLNFFSACCALPTNFEKSTKSNQSDIKRYFRL